MSEIAQHTYNRTDFNQIFAQIWLRMEDVKNWRHVYKSLNLLDYLIINGSESCAEEAINNKYNIIALKNYEHFDETGVNRGKDVVAKTKKILDILEDPDQLQFEREKAKANRGKYQGISSDNKYGGFGSGGGSGAVSGGFSSDDYHQGKIAGVGANAPRRPSFEDQDNNNSSYPSASSSSSSSSASSGKKAVIVAPSTPLFDGPSPMSSPMVVDKKVVAPVNLLDFDMPSSSSSSQQSQQQQTNNFFNGNTNTNNTNRSTNNNNNNDVFGSFAFNQPQQPQQQQQQPITFNASFPPPASSTSTTTPNKPTLPNNFDPFGFSSPVSQQPFQQQQQQQQFGNFQAAPAPSNNNFNFNSFNSVPPMNTMPMTNNNNNNNNNFNININKPQQQQQSQQQQQPIGKGVLADLPMAGLVDLGSLGKSSQPQTQTQQIKSPPSNVPLNQIKSEQATTGKVQRSGGIGSMQGGGMGSSSQSLHQLQQQQQQSQQSQQQQQQGGIPNFMTGFNNNNTTPNKVNNNNSLF
jgi:epsin